VQQLLTAEQRLSLAIERRAVEARAASLARSSTPGRPNAFRSSLGLTLIEVGRRLAAEPRTQPARPR